MKKGLLTLIFSIVAVAFAVAAVVFGAINLAGTNDLDVTPIEMSLASAILLSSVISLVLALLCGKVLKNNTLLILIPNVSTIILGLYAMSNVFVMGQNNNYIVLLIFLIIIYVVTLIVNQALDFKWATITATVAASLLLIFFLYDSLAYFTFFDNIFLCLTAFAMLFAYVNTIAYTALNISSKDAGDKTSNEVEETKAEENEVVEEETDEVNEATEEVKTEEEVKEEVVEENTINNSSLESTDNTSTNEVKEDKVSDEPYDNSSIFDEKYN